MARQILSRWAPRQLLCAVEHRCQGSLRPGQQLVEQAHGSQGGLPLVLRLSEHALRRRGTWPLGLRLGGRLGGYRRSHVRRPFCCQGSRQGSHRSSRVGHLQFAPEVPLVASPSCLRLCPTYQANA